MAVDIDSVDAGCMIQDRIFPFDEGNRPYENSEVCKIVGYKGNMPLVEWAQNVEGSMIGGDQCHLCGAHVIFESYQKFYKRKTGRIKATRDLKEYACGTIVINGEDGDSYEPWKLDTLGERCLESKFI